MTVAAPTTKPALTQRITEIFLCALALVHPLALHNGYFDITETKLAVWWAFAALYLLALAAALLLRPARHTDRTLTGTELLFLLYTAVSLLAALLSGHVRSALLAADNRYQGIVNALLTLGTVLAVSRFGRPSRSLLHASGTAFALVCLLGIANHFGADPFGLSKNLSAFSQGRYISTLGNLNFYAAYLVLFTPVFAALAAGAGKKSLRIAGLILALLGVWAAMTSRSESAVLGLAAAFALLPLLCRTAAAFLAFPVCAAAMILFSLADSRLGGAGLSAITRMLCTSRAFLLLMFVGAFLWLWLRRSDDAAVQRVRKAYGTGLLSACLALAVLVILTNVSSLGSRLPASLSKWLVLDEDWGTDRGAIWQVCLSRYRALPFWQRVIGAGSGAVARLDRPAPIFRDAIVDAAHNEYLHTLIVSGVLGLAAYLGTLIAAARAALRKDAAHRALLAGFIAYSVQAAVNIAQPLTAPLFFLLLALL